MKQEIAKVRFERIAFDVMGPLECTVRGNQYILVIQDYFTKWLEIYSIPNHTAKTVANCVVEWISRYGTPRRLHSDRAPEFLSMLFRELCDLFEVKKTYCSPYSPWSDGMVERSNRVIKSMLRHYTDPGKGDWDDYVSILAGAYRATPHASTGFSPNMMVFGVEVIQPVDLVYGIYTGEKLGVSPHIFVNELQERLSSVWQCARVHLGRAAKVQQEQFKKGVEIDRCHVYKPGDQVMKWHPPFQGKLGCDYKGPLKVLKVLDPWLVEIQDGKRVYLCSTRNLKPYIPLDPSPTE